MVAGYRYALAARLGIRAWVRYRRSACRNRLSFDLESSRSVRATAIGMGPGASCAALCTGELPKAVRRRFTIAAFGCGLGRIGLDGAGVVDDEGDCPIPETLSGWRDSVCLNHQCRFCRRPIGRAPG